MIVEKDFIDFLSLLNRNEVEYLVIGGHAMTAHDRPRYTGDLDIWVRPEIQNAERTVKTIEDFGFGSLHAYPKKKIVDVQGIEIPFIGVHELIKNKMASGRDQDLLDVKRLRKGLKD